MKRLSRRLTLRGLTAAAGAGALLATGLGVAGASAADRAAAAGPPATKVQMMPCGIKSAGGSLYIGAGNAIYRVSQRTGAATSIAPKFFASGMPLPSACGLTVDGTGNVLFADNFGLSVAAARTGTFYGQKMLAGRVYPLATEPDNGETVDVQLDPHGNVVFDVGGLAASHTDGEQDSQVFVLAERSGAFYGRKMAKGKLYVIAGVLNGGACDDATAAPGVARSASGAVKATEANLGVNVGTLRFDAEGNVILADMGGDATGGPCGPRYDVPARVDVIPARTGTYYGQRMTVGDIYPIAGLGARTGSGVPAIDSAQGATAVALDHAGNIVLATGANGDPADAVMVIAARTGRFYGQRMIKGDIYGLIRSFPGVNGATSIAVDSVGNVLVGEQYQVELLAEKTGDFYGVKARAGHVYTIAGTGSYRF